MTTKYDNCKKCHSLCIHAGKDREFVCINGVSCKITMEKPQTNADRIRAMSDEELAEFMKKIKVRAVFCKVIKNNDAFEELCSAEWLQQPAEGERKEGAD